MAEGRASRMKGWKNDSYIRKTPFAVSLESLLHFGQKQQRFVHQEDAICCAQTVASFHKD